MTYTFNVSEDAAAVDRFVENHPQNSLFQCSDWAKVKDNWGPYLTSVRDEENRIVATALVLSRRMPLGKCLFYIPRGPVMDYNNAELVAFYLEQLTALAKANHAIAVRFDPNVYSRKYPYAEKDQPHPYDNQNVIELLKRLGCRHKGFTVMIEEATQPRFNAALDLDEDYMKKLDHKTRQSINTPVKKGVKLYTGHEYLHEFAQAMHFTEMRKGVALRNEEYFRHMAEVYGDRCIITVAKLSFKEQIAALQETIARAQQDLENTPYKKQQNALKQTIANAEKDLAVLKEDMEKEGKDEVILAGKLAIYNKNRMEFVYMGNNAEYMRLRSSYLLYKTYLDMALQKGIHYVSMGGVEGTLDDGLTGFKSCWLMDVEEYIGEFNIVLDPFVYKAFDEVYPRLLQRAAKLRSRK
ncbi:MAG: peptidoglycan bridge formation glycyltransferase FemA/FemB family protein [Solobacterium sp.]|nr:peptidoglycan bridge formation glycyltransferase FemA/FemB family protein [Solobacterium sp.]